MIETVANLILVFAASAGLIYVVILIVRGSR
jgi:hypothetical protein